MSPLRSPTLLSFILHRPRHLRERVEQRILPFKQLPTLPLGLLQRPPFIIPTSYKVHLALLPLLHHLAPSITYSTSRPQTIATPSHNDISLLFFPRKRKAALLDTSATYSESPNTLALIKNVDMVQLMLDPELAGGPLPAYTRIQ